MTDTAEQIYNLFPQLRDAVEPAPYVFPKGRTTSRISGNQIATEFHANPPPLPESQNPVGPFRATGDCLQPYIRPGDRLWFDPTIPARDNHIVLVLWGDESYRQLIEGDAGADWLAKYGAPAGRLATKIFRLFGGQVMLGQNGGMNTLQDSRVLGVLVRHERNGQPLHASEASAITEDAISENFYDADIGPVNITITDPSGGTEDFIDLTIPPLPFAYVSTNTLRCEGWTNNPGIPAVLAGQSGASGEIPGRQLSTTSAPGEMVVINWQRAIPANTASVVRGTVIGQETDEFTIRNISLSIQVAKR